VHRDTDVAELEPQTLWDVDPAGVLDALDEGRAPGVLESQSYSVFVEI